MTEVLRQYRIWSGARSSYAEVLVEGVSTEQAAADAVRNATGWVGEVEKVPVTNNPNFRVEV